MSAAPVAGGGEVRRAGSLGIQPRVKSLRSSYTGLYPQTGVTLHCGREVTPVILHGGVSPDRSDFTHMGYNSVQDDRSDFAQWKRGAHRSRSSCAFCPINTWSRVGDSMFIFFFVVYC